MAELVSKEIITHGSKEFNFASYSHSLFSDCSFYFDAHWHEEWEIIYVREGLFRFYVNGQLYAVQKNQALLIDRYAIHSVSDFDAANGSGYNCFVFGLGFLCPDPGSYIFRSCFSKLNCDSVSLTQLIAGDNAHEREILKNIRCLDRYCSYPKKYALKIQIALLSVFEILLGEQAYTAQPHPSAAQNEIIRKALLYINQEYRTAIQINRLAGSLNISTDYFIRLFKALVGLPPKQYIRNLRIQEAASLIQNKPDLTISDIAQHVGFDDMNYFSRCFKKEMGLSPTQYRKTR